MAVHTYGLSQRSENGAGIQVRCICVRLHGRFRLSLCLQYTARLQLPLLLSLHAHTKPYWQRGSGTKPKPRALNAIRTIQLDP